MSIIARVFGHEENTKDWAEDFKYEHGVGKCIFCEEDFVGHKRRNECKECSESQNPVKNEPTGNTEVVEGVAEKIYFNTEVGE